MIVTKSGDCQQGRWRLFREENHHAIVRSFPYLCRHHPSGGSLWIVEVVWCIKYGKRRIHKSDGG